MEGTTFSCEDTFANLLETFWENSARSCPKILPIFPVLPVQNSQPHPVLLGRTSEKNVLRHRQVFQRRETHVGQGQKQDEVHVVDAFVETQQILEEPLFPVPVMARNNVVKV